MAGEIQRALFNGFEVGKDRKKKGGAKAVEKLEIGFNPKDKRLFLVDGVSWQELDSDEVIFLRNKEQTSVVPIINIETIKSINLVQESETACRICMDQPDELREEEGVFKGIYRVNYGNGKSEMVCERHKPIFKKDLPRLKDIGIPDWLKGDLKD